MKRTLYLALTFAGAFSATAQHDRIISNWSQSQMIYNPGAVATGQGDMSFFANIFNGTQDPWEKLAQNDTNKQMVQFANPHSHFANTTKAQLNKA
mgnify:CR=1 FL=1